MGEPTRVRDLPAPRRNPSAIGPLFQRLFAWPYRVALAGLLRARVPAWVLTLLSLGANAAVAALIVDGRWLLAGILLVPSGLFDIFDGAVARHRGEDSRYGAFLDSVIDRISDVLLFGAIFWSLANDGRRLGAGLALAALVISLGVSHLRAEGEAHGVTMSEGFFQRLERYVALMVALITGAMLPVLGILVAFGGVTVLQRLVAGWTRLDAPQKE